MKDLIDRYTNTLLDLMTSTLKNDTSVSDEKQRTIVHIIDISTHFRQIGILYILLLLLLLYVYANIYTICYMLYYIILYI